ncbi:carboxylesterase/lipase family protein [Desulfatitalea alkaliphila]|uniref:Carboxylesterase family protein n=1 Tax=Desulfatitalea alkaliphila TaxID=2929485 RepID=A0AA41R7J9_9BACT|nr:carboxylesterase family protein [Desulfatitalea alkaliphila]MCJ8502451.1 carboxylesterase family protein [Desulfatitalea alkaliphila]
MHRRQGMAFGNCQRIRYTLLLFLTLALIIGCSSSNKDDPVGDGPTHSGIFIDSPVEGLTYETATRSGTTDAAGTFHYNGRQTVTFSVGGVVLGTAAGAEVVTPVDLVPGGSTDHPAVINIARLLQTLDADGDNNNGIQITAQIHDAVAAHARNLLFDQPAADFAADAAVTALLADLNAAGVFTDLDPRDRALKPADQARDHLTASMADRIIVQTAQGALSGFAAGDSAWQWLGVPYAQPPVGDLRWRPPQPPTTWEGVRDAVSWGDQAAQSPNYEAFGLGGMSEDCLYLNITAPRDGENLPVMVYFHGGGFTILTGNTKAFNNPLSLPTKGIVLVTVNHRLGPFGYLAHPDLSAESGYGGSGNYGQMDLVAALEWIQENIAAFGGDPDNVTIFGESGGGGKVQHLLASPHAAGLFHKAILQSGMFTSETIPLATAEQGGVALAQALTVDGAADVPAAMRAVPWQDIVAAAPGWTVAAPNVDHWHLPDTVRNIFEAGEHNDVPVISGMNRADLPTLIDTMIEEMPIWADNFESNVYAYLFDHVMTGWAAQGGVAYHGIELVYVFNYPTSAYTHHALGLSGLPAGAPPPLGWGAADMAVVDDMMTMWANFARTGDPSIASKIDWTPYTAATENYLEISQGGDLAIQAGLEDAFPLTGELIGNTVSGLTYTSPGLIPRRTDASGAFQYLRGATVTFSVGDLTLGSATGAAALTLPDLVPGGTTDHQAVINIARLLQTLDADGDNNNGIQITAGIHDAVAAQNRDLLFDQPAAEFAADAAVTALMADLNGAGVFTDLDPRDRRLKAADQAKDQLVAGLADRIEVETAQGMLRGYGPNGDTWQWLGIPYAQPPVGDLRWRPPQPPVAWSGVREALAWGNQAAQNPAYEAFGLGGMGEDCLYLNVTAPRGGDDLPVMVWFHGGGFSILTGNTKAFNNPLSLPTKDVVLVTVNHRLGPFGYLAHPDLSAESDYGGSGNYGQMDLIAALEWVQANIAAFGGNPGNVTLFGESGGGGKVQHLLPSPLAAGLFHKAIIQSGMYPRQTTALAAAEAQGEELAVILGVDGEADPVAAMRALSWMEVDAAMTQLVERTAVVPNVDGHYLPDTIENIFTAGTHNDVPLISGMNKEDMPHGIALLISEMPWMADLFDSDIYVYLFDHVPQGWRDEGVGAYHGIELVYLFNYVPSLYVHHAMGLTGLPAGEPAPPTGWGAADVQVVDSLMSMWAQFALTGDPSLPGVAWTPHTSAVREYLEMGQGGTLAMEDGLENAFD